LSTNRIANIIVASTNSTNLDNFSSKLGQHNFTVLTCDNNALETKAKTAHPDLIVIDVSCADYDGFEAAQKLKSNDETSHIPVVLSANEKSDELYNRAVEIKADDIFIHSFDIKEFIIHIKPLLRLSTMFMELDNRVSLAKKFKVPASSEINVSEDIPYQILLIAPKDGDKATLETILDGNCNIEICTDFFAAEDRLTDGTFDAAICHLDSENQETVLSFSSRARNNPRLFNLPMIVMSEGQLKDRMDAYRRGVTRIVKRPLSIPSLKAKIKMLVRRQRLRWDIRNAIETTREHEVIDDVSHAYKRDFFTSHLETQLSNAHKWQKNLAVIFFSIPNIPSIQEQFGDKAVNHLLQQIYQWIASLTRVEDLVTRFDNHEFCITLPDTPIDEAQIVMHRIAGILSYTDFAVIDVFQPISVWVESGITSVELGDDVDILIQRARKNID